MRGDTTNSQGKTTRVAHRTHLMATAAIAICMVAGGAQAQDVRGQSVSERDRPEYDPIGLRVGSFFINPSLTLTEAYDDNVRASDTGAVEDFVSTVNPNVLVSSNWSRHELILEGDVEAGIYADETDEDYLDWTMAARGRLDVRRDTTVTSEISYAELHEDRTESNAVTLAVEPTEYSRLDASGAINQRFNRLTASAGGSFTQLDFDDVGSTLGGVIDNDGRDRDVVQGVGRLGYDVSPGTNVFVQGTYNVRNYDLKPPAVALDRDSSGYEVVTGAQFDITSITTGEVFAGYQSQDYDSPLLPTADGPSFGATVQWYATPITTVSFYAASTVEESTTAGAGGFLRQSGEIAIEHELLRSLIASGSILFRNEDYQGITREDDYIQFNIGADYLINRNFTAGFNYDFVQRDSNIAGRDFDRNVIGLTIKGQI